MKNWIKIDQPTIDEVNSLQMDLKIPHFICSLLLQRDVNSLDKAKFFFRPELDSLHDPYPVSYTHLTLPTSDLV